MQANLPIAPQPRYRMAAANEPVDLYQGKVWVEQSDGGFIETEGSVAVQWLPVPRTKFTCGPVPSSDPCALGKGRAIFSESPDDPPTDVRVTSRNVGPETVLAGNAGGHESGNGERLERATFPVPNLNPYDGEPVKNADGAAWCGRASLKCDEWTIYIDEILDTPKDDLKSTGGYAITHAATVRRADGSPFSATELNDLLESLRWLLSFYNGRWTGPMLPCGFANGSARWCRWSLPFTTQSLHVRRWSRLDLASPLDAIFPTFRARWRDETWREAISGAIYWYVTANAPRGALENQAVLSLMAFENLAWAYLVHESSTVSNSQFSGWGFARKLRQLLDAMGIPRHVPPQLHELSSKMSIEDWTDGPDCVAGVRHCHVHPSPSKLKRLGRIGLQAQHEAGSLSLQYLELCLLRVLGYTGKYLNRTVTEGCVQEAIEDVPWTTAES